MKNCAIIIVILSFNMLFSSCKKIENFTEIESPRFAGNYGPILLNNPETIKVVSYNIEFAMKIDEAIKEIESSENLKDADIILLQEMDEVGTETIAKMLEYNYIYYPASRNHDGQLFGLSILSKWPIADDEKILLPHEAINERRRIAITANLLIGEQSLRVYNIHTGTFTLPKAKRRDQFKALINHLDALEESQIISHVLIAGDFNTDKSNDIEYLVEIYKSKGLLWASEEIGPTYQVFNGLSNYTLDHFFCRGFDLLNAGKNKKTTASDHLPIWINLNF